MNKEEKTNYESYKDISKKVMEELLYEFSKTPMYQAYLKYLYERDAHLISSLATQDPFKEPTLVARSQGFRNGSYDLKNLIDIITKNKEEGSK